MYGLLLYGVPIVLIITTLYVGYLGFRFYITEVVRAPAGEREEAE
ncbi:hypothetical protein [Nonomuraea turcica]|nr:hypothetical protein [Nonomuraea sp. G32]MDP4511189.1 hypothetical protein [Nonomuraea sp. G32]